MEVKIEDDIREAVSLLGWRGMQRVVVKDQVGKECHILSQMDIVRWINDNPSYLPEHFLNIKVGEIVPSHDVAFIINEDEIMMDALEKISTRRYCGTAVLNSRGAVVCNFSISDLGALADESSLEMMKMSVGDFMIQTKKVPKQIVHIPKDITLGDCVHTLIKEHIHHVFVTEPRCAYSDSFSCPVPYAIFSVQNVVAHFDHYLRGINEAHHPPSK